MRGVRGVHWRLPAAGLEPGRSAGGAGPGASAAANGQGARRAGAGGVCLRAARAAPEAGCVGGWGGACSRAGWRGDHPAGLHWHGAPRAGRAGAAGRRGGGALCGLPAGRLRQPGGEFVAAKTPGAPAPAQAAAGFRAGRHSQRLAGAQAIWAEAGGWRRKQPGYRLWCGGEAAGLAQLAAGFGAFGDRFGAAGGAQPGALPALPGRAGAGGGGAGASQRLPAGRH